MILFILMVVTGRGFGKIEPLILIEALIELYFGLSWAGVL